jgi:selenocysteine-specific elongation factor
MTRHVVIGTAGHVDHGKTALVKALTGVDTDRWEEERRRGITIDLGFAPLDLGGGLTASVVDVPGHEDFVRNMVAGATGIDVALLVIAADEGIMPQTSEHLAILEFLGVGAGVVAVSKADLVEPEWLDLVTADVRDRLRRSSIRWEEPVACSAVAGTGQEALRAALGRSATRAIQRADDDLFRMPVDRAFSVAGAGTVVTGTTWSGAVRVGDEVRVLPGAARSRIRRVEVHGHERDRAEPGRRTALALPGVERHDVIRGCVVVAGDGWRETTVLDGILTVMADARPITQRSRVRLHLGTAEVMARVTPAAAAIAPGETGAARLRLEAPIVARWGDRAVLRSYSPVHTIGGVVVVDPDPPARPRRPVALEGRADPDMARRLGAFAAADGVRGLSAADATVRVGFHPSRAPEAIQAARDAGTVVLVGDRLLAPARVQAAEGTVRDTLARHHREHPLALGMPLELVRAEVGDASLADAVCRVLEQGGVLAVEGGVARLATHRPALGPDEERWANAIGTALEQAGYEGRTVPELSTAAPGPSALTLAEYLVRIGRATRVGRERYYDAEAVLRLRGEILDEIAKRGTATPAELRARTGLSRKYLIPILEWLDGGGFTVRAGDARRLGPAAKPRDATA